MCGRYAATKRPDDLTMQFEAVDATAGTPLAADFNVAPTKPVPAILTRPLPGAGDEPVRQLRVLRWGLVPSWAKDPSVSSRLFNARAETVPDKPAFRRAFERRRCLLPADGWYEWGPPEGGRQVAHRRQPYFVTGGAGGSLALAGLYEFWGDRAEGGDLLVTATVITTAATGRLAALHDRMPLVLAEGDWERWLDPTAAGPVGLLAPTRPDVLERLRLVPVARLVNDVANNGPELIAALADTEPAQLF